MTVLEKKLFNFRIKLINEQGLRFFKLTTNIKH